MKEFLSIISNLNLSEAKKTRLSLDNINIGALGALLGSSKGAELIRELAKTPELHQDIYAVAAKRKALADFEAKLGTRMPEAEWQAFFEANQWIFGHGLHYISLEKASKTLSARTTGNEFLPRPTVDSAPSLCITAPFSPAGPPAGAKTLSIKKKYKGANDVRGD